MVMSQTEELDTFGSQFIFRAVGLVFVTCTGQDK